MSEENVETLRRVYSDWGRGNLRAGTTVFAPDVVCTWQVPEGRIMCRGPQEIRENMRGFLEQWSEWRMEAGEFLDLDAQDGVLVVCHTHAKGRESGVEMEATAFHAWVFRNNMAVAWHSYFDRDRALEAAGLRE